MAAPQKKYNTQDLRQKDIDHNIHPWTNFASFKDEGSLVMSHSDGAYVFDSDGREFSLFSYGADGERGGEGDDADVGLQ